MVKPLDIDFDSDGEVVVKEEGPRRHLCQETRCKYKAWGPEEEYLCAAKVEEPQSVWNHWEDPGWCPYFLWWRESRKKEYDTEYFKSLPE